VMLAFLTGCVTIRLRGIGIDKFLVLAQKSGLVMEEAHRRSYMELTLRVPQRQERLVFALCAREDFPEAAVLSRHGLPQVFRVLMHEAIGVFMFALALATLYWAYGKIWSVHVEAGDPILEGRILSCLEDWGIRSGGDLGTLEPRSLEYRLVAAFPELKFTGITAQGTRILVEAVPLDDTPKGPEEDESCDLKAKFPALVEKVSVYRGTAAVAPGDTVEKGQILIRGVTDATEGLAEPQPVHAWGEVTALVWLTGVASEAELTPQVVDSPARTLYAFHAAGLRIPLYWREPEGAWVIRTQTVIPGPWKTCPFSLETVRVYEARHSLVEGEALYGLLAQKAARKAVLQAGQGGQYLSLTESSWLDGEGYLTVQVVLEVRMDIAEETAPTR